jgi:hypothetical protein
VFADKAPNIRELIQAVKNNPEKFPDGYTFELGTKERQEPIKSFDRFKKLKHSSAFVKMLHRKRALYASHYSKKS